MTASNALGEYLRARRELIDPADAGVRTTGVRRTPGLRREEVATLAGISADYYLRLEQGRDRHPSVQVLESLARVLGLDEPATAHLLGLVPTRRPSARALRPEVVPAGALQLLDALDLPAVVENRLGDVLARNRGFAGLFPQARPGTNRLRALFLDPGAREAHPDWEQLAGALVASLRRSIGADVDDPRAVRLVGELSLSSEVFRRLWARHDAREMPRRTVRLTHPEVGPLELRKEKLGLSGDDGLVLVVYHAEPGSDAARSLALLGSIAATEDAAAQEEAQERAQGSAQGAGTGDAADAGGRPAPSGRG